jgi:hypothetical protein
MNLRGSWLEFFLPEWPNTLSDSNLVSLDSFADHDPETRTSDMEDPSENKENIPPYAALPSYGTLAPLPAHPSRPTLPLAPPLPPHLPGSVLPLAPAVPPLQPTVLAPATAETPVPRPHHPATAVQFPSATPATATSMLSAGHTPSAPNNLTTPINNVGVSTALSQSIQGSAFKPKIYRQQIHDKDSVSHLFKELKKMLTLLHRHRSILQLAREELSLSSKTIRRLKPTTKSPARRVR